MNPLAPDENPWKETIGSIYTHNAEDIFYFIYLMKNLIRFD